MKEQERNSTPESVNTELTIIPTSIRIQEDRGRFNALSMAIEFEGLPHMVIAQKPRYSSWFIHAPTPPYTFNPLVSTAGIDITTAQKMLEMLDAQVTTDDPVEIGALLREKLDKKKPDYEKIHDDYLKNPEKKQAYGDAVRVFVEDLKNRWDSKKVTQ